MLTKFYTDTLTTKFIKHLVADIHTPTYNVWKPGDFVMEGLAYITKDYVVKANATGNPSHIDDLISTGSKAGERFFKILFPYVFGKKYNGLTSNYVSNIKGYDNRTHYALGQYLRAVRDLKGVDLMPFYNCVNNEYIRGINFKDNGEEEAGESSSYNILCVPITFDQTYTIGLSSSIPIQYGFIMYDKVGYLKKATRQLNTLILNNNLNGNDEVKALVARDEKGNEILNKDGNPTYIDVLFKNIGRCDIRSPYIIKSPRFEDFVNSDGDANSTTSLLMQDIYEFSQYRKYLKLILKIPKSLNTSVTVLEGDYSLSCEYTFNNDNGDTMLPKVRQVGGNIIGFRSGNFKDAVIKFKDETAYKSDLSRLSLLQLNTGVIYAFSDKLIEYLLLNVITPIDNITSNISRIQEYASSKTNARLNNTNPYTLDTPLGTWSESLQKYLFTLAMDSPILDDKLDINGYVDKEVDKLISRGQEIKWQNNIM